MNDSGINVYAGLLMLSTVIIFLFGVNIGKIVINTFTVMKVVLIVFMIVTGFSLFQPSYITTLIAPMGISGIMRGATSCFFGYVGYDEVCCLGSETIDPNKNIPRAVFITIMLVTLIYCLASLSLVGLVPYDQIDKESGFSVAFEQKGLIWAHNITAIGELVTLPLVVIVSFLAQPRLQYAMEKDKLIPKIFGEIDKNGNLTKGIIISGVICVFIALFIPFSYLDDVISAGVLISFILTNCSLILIRSEESKNNNNNFNNSTSSNVYFGFSLLNNSNNNLSGNIDNNLSDNDEINRNIIKKCKYLLFTYILTCLLSVLLITYTELYILSIVIIFIIFYVSYLLSKLCIQPIDNNSSDVYFKVPLVPYTPLFGIYINMYLICQLSMSGILFTFSYFGIATLLYIINMSFILKSDEIIDNGDSSISSPIHWNTGIELQTIEIPTNIINNYESINTNDS